MSSRLRTGVKSVLARTASDQPAEGVTILIYHRVGGGTTEELDTETASFEAQVRVLHQHEVVSIDDGLDALEAGDRSPRVVLTFDDGFEDVYAHAWPLLRDRGLPFTIYVATGYVGETMHWEGSTAEVNPDAKGLRWEQLQELASSELCTVGNHTHTHPRPEHLTTEELDRCSDEMESRLGLRPRHFAYTWGIPVPRLEDALRSRFRSAVTGAVGRNLPGTDPLLLRRVPVRRTDPLSFFEAKLHGRLGPERAYAGIVNAAKRMGLRA